MYEFRTTLPGDDTSLDISVYDKDDHGDDFVGSTSIELADRWYSPEWQSMEMKPIELRPIYVPISKMVQGKLELWVDIMTPEEARLNPPEDIRPPEPERWQVRTIIWTVNNVIFDGEVDLFVTGKLGDHKHQLTDTHWSSPDGRGEFNWRLIWDVIIPSRKENRLLVQIWDKNMVSTNEALAECTVNLTNIFKNAYRQKDVVHIQKQPIDLTLPYKKGVQGTVELEIEIVPYQYALDNPVRVGRDGLPDVNRPPPPWDPIHLANKISGAFDFVKGFLKGKLMAVGIVIAVVVVIAIILFLVWLFK